MKYILACFLQMISALPLLADDLTLHLNWCSRDWGVNEGASEAADIAARYYSYYDPTTGNTVRAALAAGGGVESTFGFDPAGELLKRPTVMAIAAIIAVANPDDGINLALTCQEHNKSVQAFLSQHPTEVLQWLAQFAADGFPQRQ